MYLAMDFDLEKVPAWAQNWCYYFAALGFVSIFVGVLGLFMGKKVGFGMALVYLVATLVQAATSFTLFWMCRTTLHSKSCGA